MHKTIYKLQRRISEMFWYWFSHSPVGNRIKVDILNESMCFSTL